MSTIDPLKVDHAAVKQPLQAPDPSRGPAPSKSTTRDRDAGSAEPASGDQVLLSANLDGKFKERQLKHEQDNALAGAVRKTDRAMQALGQKIDAAKAPLDAIVKNFPPFSPEDKARMKLLREYSSIRKEIDQLTLPPPPDLAKDRKAVAVPPPLEQSADDRQIADHLAKLDAATAALSGRRAGLAADTASFSQGSRFSGLFSAPEGAETAASGPILTESSAVQKSAEVGRQFAESVRQGVTVDHSKFLKGLS
ncbi:MAG: hypothetical protein A2075_21595 [Geobacteraceae bacterium GWC2_58_44]|nr:MAG: hypothetical protein A2075_21595 [Geobacteraceae bacterium GWC2_58_44]